MSAASDSRSSAETKARILLAAQTVFAEHGYSHAGLREIARQAQVAPSLLLKYFGTKARLFEEALIAAIIPLQHFQSDRPQLGEAIVASVLDPGSRMVAPAMIALALGDPESRAVTVRVVQERIVGPMADWLDGDEGLASAINLLAMTTGFAIFHRNMDLGLEPRTRQDAARLMARALQAMADG
ncbi:TetR family transcriptional regulator [Novosphingobium soli]|uniref:TetR family transcriptional regulator n=1 Tax=Novosphingobium soli TaxID=574956 RepID=A0ABV6CX32_9SPHN